MCLKLAYVLYILRILLNNILYKYKIVQFALNLLYAQLLFNKEKSKFTERIRNLAGLQTKVA